MEYADKMEMDGSDTQHTAVCGVCAFVKCDSKRRHACRSQAPSLSHETHFTPHSVVVQRNSRELSYLISKCKHDSQSQKCQSSLKEFNYSTNKELSHGQDESGLTHSVPHTMRERRSKEKKKNGWCEKVSDFHHS